MITIDVSTTPQQVAKPSNWQEVAGYLGVSPRTIASTRNDLGLHNTPLDEEVLERMRRVIRWCELRNKGGGSFFTRRNFIVLEGKGELESKLRECGII